MLAASIDAAGQRTTRGRSMSWPTLVTAVRWLSLLLVLVIAGCSRSPEVRSARYLDRGDAHAARGQLREAILEYRNALRLTPGNERAIRQLGLSHYQLGDLQQALRYLLKAEELAPGARDIRLKVATIYFLDGKWDDARQELAI